MHGKPHWVAIQIKCILMLIINITLSSNVIGLKDHVFSINLHSDNC